MPCTKTALATQTPYTLRSNGRCSYSQVRSVRKSALLRMHAMALRLRAIGTSSGTTTVLPKARGSQRNSKPPSVAVAFRRPLFNIKFPSAKMRLSRKGGNSKKNKVSAFFHGKDSPIVGFYKKLRCCLR